MKTLLMLVCLFAALPAHARVYWDPMPDEAYQFGKRYPEAQGLLYAFDYGHALVYERLLHLKGQTYDAKKEEAELLDKIKTILNDPPNTKADEEDIGPDYVFTFPLLIQLFDWSHLLHQFAYDILATSEDRGEKMIRRVNQIFDQYKKNDRVAITDTCKTMSFMHIDGLADEFIKRFPKLNWLIWSYHWYQIKLYEALMKPTLEKRDAAIADTVKEFKSYLVDLPRSAPFATMPLTAIEAPEFAAKFPTIPNAFDNVHMLHDLVSGMLTSEKVPATKLRTQGVRFGRLSQDPNAYRCIPGVFNANIAELAMHRTEYLVSQGKISDSFLWKVRNLSVSKLTKNDPKDPAYEVIVEQYPGADGTVATLQLTMDSVGKALKYKVKPGTESEKAPNWPDKDPLTLSEESLHYLIDHAAAQKDLEPFFKNLQSVNTVSGNDKQGALLAVIDIRAEGTLDLLQVKILSNGTFSSAEILKKK